MAELFGTSGLIACSTSVLSILVAPNTNRLIRASRGTRIEKRLLLVPQYQHPQLDAGDNGYSLLIILNVQHLGAQK